LSIQGKPLPEGDAVQFFTSADEAEEDFLGFRVPDQFYFGYRKPVLTGAFMPLNNIAGHQGIRPVAGAAAGGLNDRPADDIKDFPSLIFQPDFLHRGIVTCDAAVVFAQRLMAKGPYSGTITRLAGGSWKRWDGEATILIFHRVLTLPNGKRGKFEILNPKYETNPKSQF
jgi:hypothetical protein